MGLRSAVAINVATMVGAGPFITLPLVVAALHGVSAVAWVVGALIALCDGLVWAELGSRYPRSGGTYTFLRESFGPRGAGRLLGFLFVWQFLFWAPLIIASGYIGFSQYAAYLVPALGAPWPSRVLALGVGIVTLAALYRPIPQIARTALVLGAIALLTLVAVALAGLTHPYAPIAHTVASTISFAFPLAALGPALVITLYDYGGYGDVCSLGDEVLAPARTIPRAVVLSVLFVGAAYLLLNLGVASAVPAGEIAKSSAIASLVAERAFGGPFATVITLAVLVTAFASTYGLLLGASRVPFAAARDGEFLAPFARLHPSGRFPAFSLLTIGLLALPASLLPLDFVIAALTAGIVLIQGVGQIVGLALARAAQPAAPFRMPLYPLPPLLALAGWLYLFSQTGALPIAFGVATLAIGALIYLVRAGRARIWPFAAAALCALLAGALPAAALARADHAPSPAFGHAIVAQRDGEPTLLLDGKPFFFWGAAFFYERLPASEWRASMLELRKLGVNTLDLYVPWNWHEIADGTFDFDGHTNPRRNLREVLRLGKELGFAFVVRPGPVIRNEWRNGGYPAWLLQRPEYGMPLHDVLEGRYPATATLQNAHSDDAAAEWMRNTTHTRYAARWLHHALAEFRPVADRVLAVQLDDDQGAYLDNQTYPAPHLQRYLRWLESQAREVIGPRTPVFINTYEMRVPASSPVWTMGNWYQSDTFAIGEHDRLALDFATATLRTNRRGPLAQSEFQAGWLAQPEDPQPRPADWHNTTLALYELLGWGVHGIIDFPVQDTLAPFGWEAPFSNALYAWDAALRYPWHPLYSMRSPGPDAAPDPWLGDRYYPTWYFGSVVRRYGALLAESRRVADVAVAYPASAYPGDPARGDSAIARFRERLRECSANGTPCEPVDLASVSLEQLRRFPSLIVDDRISRDLHAKLLRDFRAHGGRLAESVPREDVPGVILHGRDGTFLIASNWGNAPQTVTPRTVTVGEVRWHIPSFVVWERSARVILLGVRAQRLDPRFANDARLATTCDVTPSRLGLTLRPYVAACEVSFSSRGHAVAATIPLGKLYGLDPQGYLHDEGPSCCNDADVVNYGGGANNVALSATTHVTLAAVHRGAATETYRAAAFGDGTSDVVLQNQLARVVVVPDGGARVPVFGLFPPAGSEQFGGDMMRNAFDATGALRDDALLQPPTSTTDRIAKYTHSYPAGTFNRRYTVCDDRDGSVRLFADVPDIVPNGARFERVMSLLAPARLVIDERASFAPGADAERQRAVVLSAISLDANTSGMPGVTVYSSATDITKTPQATLSGGLEVRRDCFSYQCLVLAVSWRPEDVESAQWEPHRSNGTLRLVLAPGWRRVTYSLALLPSAAEVPGFVQAERAWVVANRPPNDGEVAKRYTQSPQKRPSESSCGFESHLPQ